MNETVEFISLTFWFSGEISGKHRRRRKQLFSILWLLMRWTKKTSGNHVKRFPVMTLQQLAHTDNLRRFRRWRVHLSSYGRELNKTHRWNVSWSLSWINYPCFFFCCRERLIALYEEEESNRYGNRNRPALIKVKWVSWGCNEQLLSSCPLLLNKFFIRNQNITYTKHAYILKHWILILDEYFYLLTKRNLDGWWVRTAIDYQWKCIELKNLCIHY